MRSIFFFKESADLVCAHELGDDRKVIVAGGREKKVEPLFAKSLERVRGRSRLECAAAKDSCAGFLHFFGNAVDLIGRFNRARSCHDDELLSADLDAGDIDDRVLRMESAARSLVRLLHAHDAVDPFVAHEIPFIEGRCVSHKSQYDFS